MHYLNNLNTTEIQQLEQHPRSTQLKKALSYLFLVAVVYKWSWKRAFKVRCLDMFLLWLPSINCLGLTWDGTFLKPSNFAAKFPWSRSEFDYLKDTWWSFLIYLVFWLIYFNYLLPELQNFEHWVAFFPRAICCEYYCLFLKLNA